MNVFENINHILNSCGFKREGIHKRKWAYQSYEGSYGFKGHQDY